MGWLTARLGEGSTYKAVIFAIAVVVSHFVLHMDWYQSFAAGAAAYASGSLVLPDKIGTAP